MKLFIVLAFVALSSAAAVCTDCPTCVPGPNPDFPLPGDQDCSAKLVFIMDESGSLMDFREGVVRAATSFWTSISELNGLGGSAQLGLVEFSNEARVVQPTLRALDAAYLAELSTYVNSETNGIAGYSPQGTTNWGAALRATNDAFTGPNNTPDIIVFFTDGEPNGHEPFVCDEACHGLGQAGDLGQACYEADKIKSRGIKIFTVAVGDSAGNVPAIQVISGGSTTSTPFGAGATEWDLQVATFGQADYVVDPDVNNLNSVLMALARAICPSCTQCAIFPTNPNPDTMECAGPTVPTLPDLTLTTEGNCGPPRISQTSAGFTGGCRVGTVTTSVAVLDECDQESDRTASFTTRIIDTTPPVLTCPESGERGTCPEALQAINALQATATDTCSESFVVKSPVRSLLAGPDSDVIVGYEVTFEAEDACENAAEPCVVQYSCAQGADLEVIKTSNIEDCAVAGDEEGDVRYTVIVRNLGPALARDVVLTDIYPIGGPLERRGTITVTQGTVSENSTGLVWSVGDVPVGTRATISFRFFLDSSFQVGLVTNYAQAISPTPDPNLCNNEDRDVVRVCRESDLSITKTDNTLQVTAGELVGTNPKAYVYETVVTNNGVSDANNVRVVDEWPEGFVRGSVQAGDGGVCTDNELGFECVWPTIPAGESRTMLATYTVPANTPAGPQINSVHVSSDSREIDGENNHAHDTTFVRTEADLAVFKDDGVTSVTAGDGITYTYTLRVVNNGPSQAREVRLTDMWPAGISRSGAALTPTQGSCVSTNGDSFSCNLGELAPGQEVTVEASYTVPSSTEECDIYNVAMVCGTVFDPNQCNNDVKDVNSLLEQAELEVSKRVVDASGNEVNEIALGSTEVYYYEVSVSNGGPSTARQTTITDTWPTRLTQLRETLTCTQGGCVTTGADFTCALGSVRALTRVDCRVAFTLSEQQQEQEVLRNSVSAFSPTDEECRSAFHNLIIFSDDRKRSDAKNGAAPEHISVKALVTRHDDKVELDVTLFNPHTHSVTLQRVLLNYRGERNAQVHAVLSDAALPRKVMKNTCSKLKGTPLKADASVQCKVLLDAPLYDAVLMGSVSVQGVAKVNHVQKPVSANQAVHQAPKRK